MWLINLYPPFKFRLLYLALAIWFFFLSNLSFAITEILAYSVAMSRSAIIAYCLVRRPRSWKHSWKKYLVPTTVEIAIVVLDFYIGSVAVTENRSRPTI